MISRSAVQRNSGHYSGYHAAHNSNAGVLRMASAQLIGWSDAEMDSHEDCQ
jgi:hypothetical protein